MIPWLYSRPLVFLLASLSFACLLGEMYRVWSMHAFGCLVLPPATIVLAVVALRAKARGLPAYGWIVRGTLAGVAAAVAYDLYRLPFVLTGTPLFKVFHKFGAMLLGGAGPDWLAEAVGWTYHFYNGASLGMMFLAMTARPTVLKGVAWAMTVEAILLLTPYAGFFGLALDGWFVFLTASAHAVFGLVLGGLLCNWREPAGPR